MAESTQQTKEVFRPTIQLRNGFSILSVDNNYPTDEDNGEIEIEHTIQPTAKKHLTTDQDASPVTKYRNNKVNQNDYNQSTTDGTTQTDCHNHNKTTKEKQSNRTRMASLMPITVTMRRMVFIKLVTKIVLTW